MGKSFLSEKKSRHEKGSHAKAVAIPFEILLKGSVKFKRKQEAFCFERTQIKKPLEETQLLGKTLRIAQTQQIRKTLRIAQTQQIRETWRFAQTQQITQEELLEKTQRVQRSLKIPPSVCFQSERRKVQIEG